MSQCHRGHPALSRRRRRTNNTLCFRRCNACQVRGIAPGYNHRVCGFALKDKMQHVREFIFPATARPRWWLPGGRRGRRREQRRRRWVQQVLASSTENQPSRDSLVCLHPAEGPSWLPPHKLLLKVNSRIWYASLHSCLYLDLPIRKASFNRFWLRVAPLVFYFNRGIKFV
jgi:hypothetical protein